MKVNLFLIEKNLLLLIVDHLLWTSGKQLVLSLIHIQMCIRDRLYTGPYVVSKIKNNNSYEVKEMESEKIKGVYNQASMKKYYE